MLKNTPQPALLNLESWLQTHAPSVQSTTQSWFWVSLRNLASDKTLSVKVSQRIDCARALGPLPAKATDSGSSRNMPHFEVHGGHVKRSRLLGASFSRRSVSYRGHLQSICSSPSGSSPQKKTQRGFRSLAVKLPLFVSKHSHKGAHRDRFVAREESWYCSSLFVVASLSMPAVDSVPLMSLRLFPAFFNTASLNPCLISWSHQFSGPSSSLEWGRPSLVKSVGACQCQPIPCSTLCTVATGPSHISSPFAQQRQTRSSSAKVSGLCSAMRLNCLRHWYEAFGEGSTRRPLTKSVSTLSRHLLLRFVLHSAVTTAVRSELTSLREKPHLS